MSKTKAGRILTVFIAALLVFSAVYMPCVHPSATDAQLNDNDQSDINSLRQKQEDLKKKIAAANDAIAKFKQSAEEKEKYVNELTSQVDNYQEQIDVINKSIASLEARISELDAQIAVLDARIGELEDKIAENNTLIVDKKQLMEDTYNELCKRLRDMYMSGQSTALEMLLNADSFSTFLIRLELASGIAKRDSELIDSIEESVAEVERLNKEIKDSEAQLEADKAEIEKTKTEVEADRAEVEKSKATLEESKQKVESLLSEALSYIDKIDRQSKSYTSLINEYESQIEQFEREIDDIIQKAASRGNGTVTEVDGLICPLQYSDTYVSSGYGYRTDPISGAQKFHYGLDLCVGSSTYGRSVSAAASGTVLISTYHAINGNYIAIDHGNGVVTVYCHCSQLLVSVGATVTQGQTIAYAGSTGYVTGAHLHFEVRVNGTRCNPGEYISVP